MRRLAALLISAALALPSLAQDFLANGSFEDSLSRWSRNHNFPTERAAVVERPDRGRCLKLTSNGETVDFIQTLELPAGRYVFRLDLKRTTAGRDIAAYVIVSRPNVRDAYYSLGFDQTVLNRWQHFARVVPIPANASLVRVLLLNRIEGATAWFDDVQVVPVQSEAGPADGWSPVLRVPRVEQPPAIDGRLGDNEWADAAHITGFAIITDGSKPEADTQAWICHDGRNLLIAARCDEPLMDQAHSVTTEPDAGGIFRDEVVEIFIDADDDHETYLHFAVNSIGTTFDASVGEAAEDGTTIDNGWTAAASRGEDYWAIEASIPFASLALANSGNIWGFNICRERHVPGHRENSAWSTTGSRFHAPHRFGDLVGLAEVAQPPVRLSFAGVDDPTPGDSQMRFTVDATEAIDGVLVAQVVTPDGEVRTIKQPAALQAGRHALALPIAIDARGEWRVTASLMDASARRPITVAPTRSFLVPPLLQAQVVRPWYRGRIFSKMNLQAIEVEAQVAARDAARQGMRVVARLARDGETLQVASADARPSPLTVLSLPIANLPDGRYSIDIQLLDAADQVLATVGDLPIEKLPPAETEIWFDRDNNMIINGQPHLPLGFYSVDSPGAIRQVAEGGYSFFHTYASARPARLAPEGTWDWQRYLDAGAEVGMRAFLGFGYAGTGEEDFHQRLAAGDAPEAERLMSDFIERWKTHPALGAWYLYDEPVISGRTPEEIRTLYEMADSRDPYHPKVLCQVSWSDPRFVPWLDVLMPDPYPIRADVARPLTTVSDAIRAARATVGDRKPVWAVLQWYAYPGGRFPTPEEMRCMAFLALAAEAKGVLWYSFYYGYRDDRANWPAMQRLGRELRKCEDVVFAPKSDLAIEALADTPLRLLLKRGDEGRLHLLAVNPEDRPLTAVRLRLPVALAACTDRLSGEAITIDGTTLLLDFAPHQPRVLDIDTAR